ncbi:MAG TPA: hypothetical protein VH044_02785 [Polyangiaceae bacterium]|jgi:hypothetical protein|nr:hypothetical protein [Polyangiaceae bacterium]
MKRVWWLTAASAAFGIAATVVALQARRDSERARSRIDSLAQAMGARSAAPPEEVERVVHYVQDAPASALPPSPPAPSVAPPRATTEELAYRLGRRFQEQGRDISRDGRAAEQGIAQAFDDERKDGVLASSVACNEELCEAHVTLKDTDADKQVMTRLFRGADAKIRMGPFIIPSRVHDDDGSVTAVAYISRGGPLPIE